MKKIKLLDTTDNSALELTSKEVIELSEFYEDFYSDTGEDIEITTPEEAINNLVEFWHFERL